MANDHSEAPLTTENSPIDEIVTDDSSGGLSQLWLSEDWWAVWLGGVILLACFAAVWSVRPADLEDRLENIAAQEVIVNDLRGHVEDSDQAREAYLAAEDKLDALQKSAAPNPLKNYVSKLKSWTDSPTEAFGTRTRLIDGIERKISDYSLLIPVLVVGGASLLLFGFGNRMMGNSFSRFARGFPAIFLLTILAYVLASNQVVKDFNLEYPLWALVVGLTISNTIGTPQILMPAVRTEFYIKTGLVLLGAKILLGQLVILGLPGMFVSWVVTPIVLITSYLIGAKLIRLASPSLNMTICADMSVCGVSAAIAAGAACKAKKEELSLAIGLSLSFTAVMMFVMPLLIKALGMDPILGGAWLGGTIDATGAVAAAGAFLGPQGEAVAITVKLIQNVLIGVIAFGIAVYWVTFVERDPASQSVGIGEIWKRFPKFIIGFMAASIVFTLIDLYVTGGRLMVSSMKSTTNAFYGWFFCMAFVCIGLETDFRKLAHYFQGGKPLALYVIGQSINLLLTLLMAWLMFGVLFGETVKAQLLGQ